MNQPKVSVVIGTYNHRDFIRETLDSVLGQTYQNLEIIVADDGSTDGTAQIVAEYAARNPGKVVAVPSERNTGISSNYNRGIACVTGQYVAWLGGDDLMLPEKIGKQVALLEARPDAVGCYHDAEVFETRGGRAVDRFSDIYNGGARYRDGGVELWLTDGFYVLPSTVMTRAEATPKQGLDERLKFANDWLFFIEIFVQGKCCAIDEVLGRYRRHDANATGSRALQDSSLEEMLILMGIVNARYPRFYPLTRRRTRNLYFAAANRSFAGGDRKRFMEYLRIGSREGGMIHAILLYISVHVLGGVFARQIETPLHRRPRWFSNVIRFMKRL